MTDHGARECPGAPAQIASGALTASGELDRLAMAYPAFRFALEDVGRHGACWVARRKHGLSPGLHTVITSDLAELRAAMASPESAGHAR